MQTEQGGSNAGKQAMQQPAAGSELPPRHCLACQTQEACACMAQGLHRQGYVAEALYTKLGVNIMNAIRNILLGLFDTVSLRDANFTCHHAASYSKDRRACATSNSVHLVWHYKKSSEEHITIEDFIRYQPPVFLSHRLLKGNCWRRRLS